MSTHYQLAQRLLTSLNCTRVIPLQAKNLQNAILKTPQDFQEKLCQSIENAKDRISLATLYIGTGASQQEAALLESLSSSNVPTKILMDANRGTRPVKNTSSAQAVQEVVDDPVHLYQALHEPFKRFPSPLNEVIGVFHLKSYIVDDMMMLSGANLSQEYFSDRQDRYIKFEGGELIEFYADLVEILSNNAEQYSDADETKKQHPHETKNKSNKTHGQMLESLSHLFGSNSYATDDSVAAYAIPTFAHPKLSLPFQSDTQQLTNLLNVTADEHCRINLASAYLNPTPSFLQSLARQQNEVTLLTAGGLSHGFAPKPGVQRTGDFVPKFFAAQSQTLAKQHRVLLYNRPGWTFHAKGLWVLSDEGNLLAAVVGSGNYGYRSERRDVESNLILVFPQETSPFQEELLEEWERLTEYADEETFDEVPEAHVRAMWPVIQSYF